MSRHEGDFRRIVQGVNETLDAVINPIEEAADAWNSSPRQISARVRGQYQNDHARIKDSLNNMAEALHAAMGQVSNSTPSCPRRRARLPPRLKLCLLAPAAAGASRKLLRRSKIA